MIIFSLVIGLYFYILLKDLRLKKPDLKFWVVQILFLLFAYQLFIDVKLRTNSKEIEASIERGIVVS